MEDKLIELIENSIKKNWDRKAFTDFNGESLQYKDVARKIAKMHLLFEAADIRPGDKIALCGRNSGNWCVAFLATITYGAVIVPILHEFKPDNVHHIVNHSEARLLFVGDQVWENLNENRMPALQGIICVKDFTLVNSRSEKLSFAREHLNALFGQRFPMMFLREHVHFTPESSPEQLAVINYTSGTTGFSKGVMLPYRSLVSNVLFCNRTIGIAPGDNIVSMLPMGHVFGLVYDFLYGVCFGAHLYFLTRMPSPKVIMTTVAEFHPRIMSCVPLVIEKIFKKEVLPKIDSKLGKLLLHIPIISEKIKEKARTESLRLFGGNIKEVIIGGAPFNAEVEAFGQHIRNRGVEPNNVHLFMQGHTLMDNVVLILLHTVCDKLRDMNIDRIAAGTKQGISLKNELSNYNNSLRNVREVLLDNEQYKDCFLYRKLRQDIERYVSKLTQGSRRRYPDFSRNTQTP